MMKLYRPILLILTAALALTGCSQTVGTPTQTALPAAAETSGSYPAYPASTEAAPPTVSLPTPYQAPSEPTAGNLAPAAGQPAPTTQTITIPAGLYTCNLQGTQLPIWRFAIVQTFSHDSSAYTQGLIIRNNVLYEGTGLRSLSTLRKVALETGEVLQSISLPPQLFGEGITELDGRLYQITWQEKTGFIYDFDTFEKLGEFPYQTEGWGLTNDGSRLIMSDGSDQLYFFEPTSEPPGAVLTGQAAVTDDRGPVYRINELEYVDGEVWGNIYQTGCIVRIDPDSGKVTGWIDLTGLHEMALQAGQGAVPPEVPNGIAYDPETQRIFVTGKFWPTLYEIALTRVEAQP